MTDWTDGWRRVAPFPEADWQTWLASFKAPAGLTINPIQGAVAAGAWPDMGAAAIACAALARELARCAELAAGSAGAGEEIVQFAQRWFDAALPRWPAVDAAVPPNGAAPHWERALGTFNALLAEAARDAATRYAHVLRADAAPTTLRGLFDAWIDCAEAAFQSAAHSERYASAQAVLINEFVALRGRQQELAERLARALGQPTRAEVDALHGTLREIEKELAALRGAKSSG